MATTQLKRVALTLKRYCLIKAKCFITDGGFPVSVASNFSKTSRLMSSEADDKKSFPENTSVQQSKTGLYRFMSRKRRGAFIPRLSSVTSVEDWEKDDLQNTVSTDVSENIENEGNCDSYNVNEREAHVEKSAPTDKYENSNILPSEVLQEISSLNALLENVSERTPHISDQKNYRPFIYGELVLIRFLKNAESKPKLLHLSPGNVMPSQNRGQLSSEQIMSKKEGDKLQTTFGYEVQIWRPSLEDYVTLMRRGPVLCHTKVGGVMLTMMGVESGDIVLDAGTGSGGSLLMLSKAVGQNGHVHTIDRNRKHTRLAQNNISLWKDSYEARTSKQWPDNITYYEGDIEGKLPEPLSDIQFDGVHLDVKSPQCVLPVVTNNLKCGKYMGIYCPNITQVVAMLKYVLDAKLPLLVENVTEEVDRTWVATHESKDLVSLRPEINENNTAFTVYLRKVKSIPKPVIKSSKSGNNNMTNLENSSDYCGQLSIPTEVKHFVESSTEKQHDGANLYSVDISESDSGKTLLTSARKDSLLCHYHKSADSRTELSSSSSSSSSQLPSLLLSQPYRIGDLVMVTPFIQRNKGKKYECTIQLTVNGLTNTHYGLLRHSELAGLSEGDFITFKSEKGKTLFTFRPTLEQYSRSLTKNGFTGRVAQLVCQMIDAMFCENVLVVGNSAGIIPLYLSRQVSRNGQIHTYIPDLKFLDKEKMNIEVWRQSCDAHSSDPWPDKITVYTDEQTVPSSVLFDGICMTAYSLGLLKRMLERLQFSRYLVVLTNNFLNVVEIIKHVCDDTSATVEEIYEDYERIWILKPHSRLASDSDENAADKQDYEEFSEDLAFMCRPKHRTRSGPVYFVKIKKTG